MRNLKLVPYETIVRAASGEPETVDEVLQHYGKQIQIASLENRQINKDTEDNIKRQFITALADMIPPGIKRWGRHIPYTIRICALCYLSASSRRVFTKTQIFESVWSMESESCQSSIASVIYNPSEPHRM